MLGDLLHIQSLLGETALAVGEAQSLAQSRESTGAVLPVARVVPMAQAMLDLGGLCHVQHYMPRGGGSARCQKCHQLTKKKRILILN